MNFVYPIALLVFTALFLLITVLGFLAVRWKRPAAGMHSLDQ